MIHVSVEGFKMVMEVLGLVAGVLGAFIIFFVFMPEKNEGRYSGKLAKLYDFLNFRCYMIEGLLKFFYVLAACLCTGIGLFMALTVVELTRGLVLLVGGNLAVRIVFEFLMMLMKACRNLGEVGREDRICGKEEKKEMTVRESKDKICPNCGEKCSSEFAFCNICGTKLS